MATVDRVWPSLVASQPRHTLETGHISNMVLVVYLHPSELGTRARRVMDRAASGLQREKSYHGTTEPPRPTRFHRLQLEPEPLSDTWQYGGRFIRPR